MGLYAFLVGSWSYDAAYHPSGQPMRRTRGEIHAGWVLDGRAIQDIWRVPARGKDIVQEGRDEATGAHTRWSFSDLTRDSFRWTGEASPDGKDRVLLADFQAKRIP